ncbi:MAG: ATP-binding protein [Oceanospirillaceae bacterium]
MSFRLKTILGIALIEAVLLLALISMTLDYLKSSNYDALSKRATTTATLFATTTKDGVLSYDLASLEAFVSEVLKNHDLKYARVLGPQNQLFASGGDQVALDREFKQDLQVAAVTDGIYDTFADISEAGVIYGRVELGLDIAPIIAIISEAQQRSAIIGLVEMSLVALFSLILGSYLTGQLKVLRAAAKSIAKGDLDIDVPVRGRDEIADVAKAFNSMAKNLRIASERRDNAEVALKELNLSLEASVISRTAQLEARNQQLSAANKEIKAAQTQLLQSEKMASLGLLAAGVAHEINNPMSFVISNIATLQRYQTCYQWLIEHYRILSLETDEQLRSTQLTAIIAKEAEFDMAFIEEDIDELLKDTQEGSLRVKDIVKGLKEFSHVDHDNKFTLYDIDQCIQSTLKVVNSQLKYHCEVQLDLQPLPLTMISVGQMNQVFLNIIINASQAVKERGLIKISSRALPDKIIIQISDDGEGIAPEKLANIFDPFYTTKAVGQGTGLGLSISYGIVEEHHGTIKVESTLGLGSCFSIELPIISDATSLESQPKI